MSDWTPEEIENLYNQDRAKLQKGAAIPHRSETLSHRLISLYEGWIYFEERISDPETHKTFESDIKAARVKFGQHMSGLSEEDVAQDPEAAKRKVVMYILNRMRVMCE